MRKKKLLTVLLFCLSVTAVSWSAEVISIDLNGYGDANAYTGLAASATAAAGTNVWRAYYGGYGEPMGSARTSGLVPYDEPNMPGTYASEVWIGDPGTNHTYISGSALMDDGFQKDPNASANPSIHFIAEPQDPCFSAGSAYSGTFDIYVYGDSAGDFNLTTPSFTQTKSVTGTVSGFVEGENYVVFSNVVIDDTNEAVLSYSGELNAIQLVSKKQPVAMQDGTVILAADYDVAFETNSATGGGVTEFGPDIGSVNADINDYNSVVGYIGSAEYMQYDITADDVNAGQYDVVAYIITSGGNDANIALYIDGISVGNLYFTLGDYAYPVATENTATFNIFEGSHEFEWRATAQRYYGLVRFEFTRLGDISMPDCSEVYKYGYNYAGDYNGDCHVDAADLNDVVSRWAECYSPDPNDCN